jgi:NADP-dependent 3-hydroxy acid dehydrogenase YdfG
MKHQNEKEKVWFITGTSRGFGRIWTEAALQRGDKVAATARNLESIADLKEKYGANVLTLQLDVTKPEQVKSAIEQAHAHFGQLDIVFNNAGYSLIGMIEEAKPDDIRAMFETNVWGAVSVIQTALPILRKQEHGHILGTSSTLGHLAYPMIGYYCSSKWTFEAIHEALATEVKPFGINVTIVEPDAYATEFGSPDSLKFSPPMDIYADFKAKVMQGLTAMQRGNPNATAEAILNVVDAQQPPLRLFLGSNNLNQVRTVYDQRIKTWEEWAAVSKAAQGNK